jgi:hypothetical protein
MRHLLTILAALFVCAAPAQAQTLKSLMFNSTNGQVVANTGTNVLTFPFYIRIADGGGIESTYSGTSIDFDGEFLNLIGGSAVNILSPNGIGFIHTNSAGATRTNLGLGATNNVVFNHLIAGATNQPAQLLGNIIAQNGTGEELHINSGGFTFYQGTNAGGYFAVEERSIGGGAWIWDSPFTFANPSIAATTRTNLGATVIGNAVFTATNAVAARQALGLQSYTNTLTNSVNDVEIGSTVSNVTIGWTIAPTDATYAVRTLVGASQTNSITNNSSTLARTGLALTSNTTWTLTVGDGLGVTNTATTSVNFLNYMIWGRSTNTTLDNTAIQNLHTNGGGSSRAFATSRARSFTMDGGGQFIFIAYPAGFGSASFTVGGLPNTAFTLTTNSYTNASGYVTNYLIYRTDTIQNGTGINFVVQ